MPYLAGFVTPQDYGAVGDGATDDTLAIQAAINAVNAANSGNGGQLFFPPATYAVTPASSTVGALVLNNGTTGYSGVRLVGASEGGTHLRKLANGPIISMSGPATDLTGNTHCRYCSLENMYLDGNSFTGTMVQTYYADNLSFHNVHFVGNLDIVQDTAEYWDSRYYNCVWEGCGSATNSASTPNVLLRDSAAASGFGFSTDSVNQIHFVGCRWEGFHQGAVWIQQGVSNSSNPNGIFLVNCKMESSILQGGPHLSVDSSCRGVYVNDLYCYSGGFAGGFSTAQNVISWSPNGASSLNNVYITNRAATSSISNGVTVSSNLAGQSAVLRNVIGMYNTAPIGAHVNFSTATGNFIIDNCVSTTGTAFSGAPAAVVGEVIASASSTGALLVTNTTAVTGNTNADLELVEATAASQAFGTRVTGDTFNRFVMLPDGTMKWGPGSGAIDASVARTGAGALTWSTNNVMSGITYLNGGSDTAGGAPVLTPTFANGTAAQLSDTTRDYMVYLQIGTAGTAFTLAIGPTSTPANTIMASATPLADELLAFRLPAGWYVKWAGTSTTLTTQKAIGC